MMRQDTIILLSGVWSYPTVMSGLLGLESLWLLAQSLRVVNDLLIMICLHGIYTYNKYKQQWVVYFLKNVCFPLPGNNHLLSLSWALELCLIYFLKAIHTWFLFVLKTANLSSGG